jgi:hypothetical protein
MERVQGINMLSVEDISTLSEAGRPQGLCNFLKGRAITDSEYIKEFGKYVVIDMGFHGNFPLHNAFEHYEIMFVPHDLVECKIAMDGVVNHLNFVKKLLCMTPKREEVIDRNISNYEDKYFKLSKKYSDDEKILNSSCCAFIFRNRRLHDVCTMIPSLFLEACKKTNYVCGMCNSVIETDNTSVDNYIPNMYYEELNKDTKYYCEDCARKEKKVFKHVGE